MVEPLTREDIALHLRRMPPSRERDQAIDAFRRKYEGKPKPGTIIRYQEDPVIWGEERLGEFFWSGQRKMMYAVRDYRRNAFFSCHRIGKSHSMGRIAFWWLDTHAPGEALVVTSAHSATQVKMALWREMARVHSKGKFVGRMNQTEYYMPMKDGREEMVAFGRKPKDDDTTAFQGTYAKYVLVLGDEACYIPDNLWNGMDTLVSNEFSRIVMFGNPDDATTRFAKVCQPGSGWNTLGFGYLHTPNFVNDSDYKGSEEDRAIDSQAPQEVLDSLIGPKWVEDKKRDWGETSPMFISKVLGEFPENTTDGLISIKWIREAQERALPPSGPIEIGVDVGGGNNANVIYVRRGPVVRQFHRDKNPDTMVTLENTLRALRETGASVAKVDYIGIGHGAVDRAKQMSTDQQVKRETPDVARIAGLIKGIEVGRSSDEPEKYINIRAKGYWNLRERFERGEIDLDPEDDVLAAQLCAIQYKPSSGRVQIQDKKTMKVSPDEADSVMLAFLDTPKEIVKTALFSWGT
jgi:hypothetical protein